MSLHCSGNLVEASAKVGAASLPFSSPVLTAISARLRRPYDRSSGSNEETADLAFPSSCFSASSEASKTASTDSTETGSSAEPGKEEQEQEQDDKGKGKDNAEEAKDEEAKKDGSGSK